MWVGNGALGSPTLEPVTISCSDQSVNVEPSCVVITCEVKGGVQVQWQSGGRQSGRQHGLPPDM